MAYRQRTGIVAAAQSVLTDDPDFLRILVERVIPEILEAEMSAHLHAEPYERSMTPDSMAQSYSTTLHITPTILRGH